MNGASKTSHINVANHVEAIQQTSRLLEQFQEGRSSVGALEKQGLGSSAVSSARGSLSANTSASVRAGASASLGSGQSSVLQVATLFFE